MPRTLVLLVTILRFRVNLVHNMYAYWRLIIKGWIKLKKINPKVTKVVLALMSVLIAGGIAAKEIFGEPDPGFVGADQHGDGLE